ncbi:threonine-phosphate decarboxylase [Sphingobium sp. Cam5-1]|uniref:threonine-phosphate decarboxylase n=1 Tax=Sphingobium sp. Cam5-1 TaxID=2789327 RepID=UPI0018AD2E04|nr:threonine-phosphate decarboxylase [Sphingobium sp. Cam5-1]QPI74848.1 pyridoxal phosphate-dependent class II aminotransferase [Sphingobium sp. Cam5-1]
MSDIFHWHGGRLAAARQHYETGLPWIDLSTGINPLAWPGAAVITPDWQSLPDPAALADLEQAAATHFGVSPDHISALPGSETGLRLLGRLIQVPGCHLLPSYRTHAQSFPNSRPLQQPEDAPPGTALLLANPNNPDGRLYMRAQMQQLLTQQEREGGWLIVDEAFADCIPGASIASEIADHRRLIVLRSFGKFFGLAGVRLGFLLGPSVIVAACRRLVGDWPLSAASIEFGRAAYRDQRWIDETIANLTTRAASLDALLIRHGFIPRGDCPLFRLIDTPNAAALFDRLARHAILTRPFEDYPHWLRFGLPADDAALARMDEALG